VPMAVSVVRYLARAAVFVFKLYLAIYRYMTCMQFVPSCTGGAMQLIMPGFAGAHRRQVRGQLSAHAA